MKKGNKSIRARVCARVLLAHHRVRESVSTLAEEEAIRPRAEIKETELLRVSLFRPPGAAGPGGKHTSPGHPRTNVFFLSFTHTLSRNVGLNLFNEQLGSQQKK